MPFSHKQATYFLHRYLDNNDIPTYVERWNTAYPDEAVTLKEVESFLVELVNRRESGQGDTEALVGIVEGKQEATYVKPRKFTEEENVAPPVLTVTEGQPASAPLPKKKFFAKKEK